MCALDLKRKLPGLNLVNVLSLDPTCNLCMLQLDDIILPNYLLMSMMINTMDDGKMNRFEIEQLHEIIIAILEIFFWCKNMGFCPRTPGSILVVADTLVF